MSFRPCLLSLSVAGLLTAGLGPLPAVALEPSDKPAPRERAERGPRGERGSRDAQRNRLRVFAKTTLPDGALQPIYLRRTMTEFGKSRVGCALAIDLPEDAQFIVALDGDLAAQAVKRQAFDQVIGQRRLAIDQQLTIVTCPDNKVEHRLALRTQQRGIGRQFACNIVRDEPLQELGNTLVRILRSEADDGAFEKARGWHAG